MSAGDPYIQIERLCLFAERPVIAEHIWLSSARFEPLMQIPNEQFGDLLYPFYEEVCHQIVSRAQESLRVATEPKGGGAGGDRQEPVVIIERVAFGLDGTPLEWRISECSAGDFSYRIDI